MYNMQVALIVGRGYVTRRTSAGMIDLRWVVDQLSRP